MAGKGLDHKDAKPCRSRVALVIPWYGRDQKGGAEQHAYQIAARLAARMHKVEVLTTCCRSFLSNWAENYHTPGVSTEDNVLIRRFLVDERNAPLFDELNGKLLALPRDEYGPQIGPVTSGENEIFVQENINSSSLLDYLQGHVDDYDMVLFIPYLYGPILRGIPLVAEKAYLQPCLHDEVYAYLPAVQDVFRRARGILFNSVGEFKLAQSLYGSTIEAKSLIVGGGNEYVAHSSITYPPRKRLAGEKFIVAIGRRDPTKNTDFIVDLFKEYRQEYKLSSLMLILAGPGHVCYESKDACILDLGLVKEQEKWWLLDHCSALLIPSYNESYSRVMMEAWLCGRAVVVHGSCLATATAVQESGGGWVAETKEEWISLLHRIEDSSTEQLNGLGKNGKEYAKQFADWDKAIDRYELILQQLKAQSATAGRIVKKISRQNAIHQLLPNLDYGDAISNHALAIRDFLRQLGYRSEVYVQFRHEKMAGDANIFAEGSISKTDGLIYHHSIGSALTKHAARHKGPKLLVFHNITPPAFFAPYDAGFAKLLDNGLSELHQLSECFKKAVGDSKVNAAQLISSGFGDVDVLPLVVEPKKWRMPVDDTLLHRLTADGVKNILFVGRLAPNKRQDDLLETFAMLKALHGRVRLCLVGTFDGNDEYVKNLRRIIADLELADDVLMSGNVSTEALYTYYYAADVFVSMSEHEGFGVPLIEAMWFDVPVIAFKSSAVPETLGDAAFMFTSKSRLDMIAALVSRVLTDCHLRDKMIIAQRKNRQRFTKDALEPVYAQKLAADLA